MDAQSPRSRRNDTHHDAVINITNYGSISDDSPLIDHSYSSSSFSSSSSSSSSRISARPVPAPAPAAGPAPRPSALSLIDVHRRRAQCVNTILFLIQLLFTLTQVTLSLYAYAEFSMHVNVSDERDKGNLWCAFRADGADGYGDAERGVRDSRSSSSVDRVPSPPTFPPLGEGILSCDSRLDIFLFMYGSSSLLLSLPLLLVSYFLPHLSLSARDASLIPVETRAQCAVRRLQTVHSMITLIVFVCGNQWFWEANTCAVTAPLLYGVTYAWMTLFYIYFSLPFTLCLLCCCCFPCLQTLLIALQRNGVELNVGPVSVSDFGRVPQEQIDALPQVIYEQGMWVEEDHVTCAICYSDYSAGESVRLLPCHHRFHVSCIDPWVQTKNQCPLCRAQVVQLV